MVMLIGKVIPKAIGKKILGFALGTEIFIAAGTAIYEALAARIAKINWLPTEVVTIRAKYATTQPFTKGIKAAKTTTNHPFLKKSFKFLALLTPMSKRKIIKNPLNRSFVNGLIPSAALSLAK